MIKCLNCGYEYEVAPHMDIDVKYSDISSHFCAPQVLIYCRSSVMVDLSMQWLDKMRLFTFDALYLHDKPTRENCPQSVYDSLVDILERVSEFESYIFESSSGSARLLFRCAPRIRIILSIRL